MTNQRPNCVMRNLCCCILRSGHQPDEVVIQRPRLSGLFVSTVTLSATEYNWAEHPTERNLVFGGLVGSVA